MSDDDFNVVINEAGQYSLWPTGRALPIGWAKEGFAGDRDSCLNHISIVWTDIRPVKGTKATSS